MMSADMARGGASVGVLTKMDPWEADCILNLRILCDGIDGRNTVYQSLVRELGTVDGVEAFENLSSLVSFLCRNAHRALVRHDVTCSSVGADEAVFCHIVRMASAGHLNDAALAATLLVGAAHAEQVALLAGEVGQAHRNAARAAQKTIQTAPTTNVVRLH